MRITSEFSGESHTRWCTDMGMPDRDMELLDDFHFIKSALNRGQSTFFTYITNNALVF